MRRFAISSALVLAMAFGFVNVDLANLFENPTETVFVGPQKAEARPGGGFSRPSRPSFSRPSRPAPRPAPRPVAPKPAPRPVAKPTTPPKAAPAKPGTTTAKPAPRTGDAASKAAARQQSRVRAAAAPKPAIRTSSGKTLKVAGTPAARQVRSTVTPQSYSTRTARKETYYRSIPVERRTVIINRYGGGFYGDPFSGLFMYMLLSQSLSHQAAFHHHHWDSYSAQRQQALIAENAALKVEMAKLQGTPRDPNFVPAGTDPDLIYSDEFVDAAYNPVPVEDEGLSGFAIFGLGLLAVLSIVGVWFVFYRRSEA